MPDFVQVVQYAVFADLAGEAYADDLALGFFGEVDQLRVDALDGTTVRGAIYGADLGRNALLQETILADDTRSA